MAPIPPSSNLTQRSQTIFFLYGLTVKILKDQPSPKMTASSRIFVHRLFFDLGFSYLKSLGSPSDLGSYEKDAMKDILKTFDAVIPSDQRTIYLKSMFAFIL